MNKIQQIIRLIIISWVIFLISIVGYMIIEDWTFLDAAYMTVLTVTTVGFMEVHQTSDAGKIFTIFVMLAGVGNFFYITGILVQAVVEGEIRTLLGRKRLDKKISKLKNHHILCGYGRIGRVLCRLIKEEKKELVVLEQDDALVEKLEKEKLHYLQGDATDETLLNKAGIHNSSFLIAALGSDAANVFLVLTARQLNPDIYILARASNQNVKKKLIIAGANHVESPYNIGAVSMGLQLLRPNVSSFLNVALSRSKKGIQIEELFIPKSSKYTNIALKDSQIRQDFNLIIIAIKKGSGEMLFNPHFETLIEPQDTVIVMGKPADLKEFTIAVNPESKFEF